MRRPTAPGLPAIRSGRRPRRGEGLGPMTGHSVYFQKPNSGGLELPLSSWRWNVRNIAIGVMTWPDWAPRSPD